MIVALPGLFSYLFLVGRTYTKVHFLKLRLILESVTRLYADSEISRQPVHQCGPM